MPVVRHPQGEKMAFADYKWMFFGASPVLRTRESAH